jgi:hypothetical protein
MVSKKKDGIWLLRASQVDRCPPNDLFDEIEW